MRSSILAASMGLALLLAGCGTVQSTNASSVRAAIPQLTVNAPRTGETFNSSSVAVSLTTRHIHLVNPATHPANAQGEGHVHLYLDQRPVVMTYHRRYTFTHLKPGPHTLKIELVTNTMTPYKGAVRTVTFTTKGSAASPAGSGSPSAASSGKGW